jgi:hypothetical protein
MKRLILTISIALSAFATQAQLTPGALAFLGFQADAPDAFAFVTLQDIPAGDSIFFTDNGWSGSAFFANENTMSWKANVAVPAASVIRIQDPNDPGIPNALIVGPGVTRGKLTGLAVAGDQLFAYTLRCRWISNSISGFLNQWFPLCLQHFRSWKCTFFLPSFQLNIRHSRRSIEC